MKKTLSIIWKVSIVLLFVYFLSSCTQKHCPTYGSIVKPQNETLV